MTIEELHDITSTAIKEGKGDYNIYFDVEARTFNCHAIAISTSYTIDKDIVDGSSYFVLKD